MSEFETQQTHTLADSLLGNNKYAPYNNSVENVELNLGSCVIICVRLHICRTQIGSFLSDLVPLVKKISIVVSPKQEIEVQYRMSNYSLVIEPR